MKQHQNTTGSLAFNGQDNSEKHGQYNSKLQHNASGKSAKANYGRGPTKVGSGSTGVTCTNPPSTASGKQQKRNPSGTKQRPTKGVTNAGIGPRKGNYQ